MNSSNENPAGLARPRGEYDCLGGLQKRNGNSTGAQLCRLGEASAHVAFLEVEGVALGWISKSASAWLACRAGSGECHPFGSAIRAVRFVLGGRHG